VAARVAVLGAAGYAGAVASALLHRHPHFEMAYVTARSDAGVPLSAVHPRSRVPLVLYHFEDMPYEDIARKLGVSLAKLKTDILRARAALAKILSRDGVAREGLREGNFGKSV
jgi:DNA-directed RNA polymerase specialized sigma24 family protein